MCDLLSEARAAAAKRHRNGEGWYCCNCGELICQLADEIERLQKDRSRSENELDRLREWVAAVEDGYDKKKAEIERLKVRLREQTLQTQQTAEQIHKAVIEALGDAIPAGIDPHGHPTEQVVASTVSTMRCEIERLQSIINAKLHQRRCHDCGQLEWTSKDMGKVHTCDECYRKFLERVKEVKE